MSENITKNIFEKLENSKEFQQMSMEWKQAFAAKDYGKLNEIYQEYSLKVENLVEKEYGIKLNTKYVLIPENTKKVTVDEEKNIWFIPLDNIYGMYSRDYNVSFINMGYKEFGTLYYDSLDKISERKRHEDGVHNFYNNLFRSDGEKALKIIEKNDLGNYQKLNAVFETLPVIDTYHNRLIYQLESQEAVARYIENYKSNFGKGRK